VNMCIFTRHPANHSSHSDTIAPQTKDYNLPDAPFGLDMSFSSSNISTFADNSAHNDFPRFPDIDLSFDQTLGLDLAPGFGYGFPTNSALGIGISLGLDMMGAHEAEVLPVVRQKRKKMAWLEVNKLLDGECNPRSHAVNTLRRSSSLICSKPGY
jgi:hypothetical protein